MGEALKILLTAGTTIVGGSLVYVIGQIASRFFIEPWHEQRKLINQIAEALHSYAPYFAGPGDLPGVGDAATRLRQFSDALVARTIGIPGYRALAALHLAPGLQDVRNGSRFLVRLSNILGRDDWQQKMLDASGVAVSLKIDGIDASLTKPFAESLKTQAPDHPK